MELRNAASTSAEALLLSMDMAYSITMASQGSLIPPSLPAKPNTSSDIRRSSLKTTVLSVEHSSTSVVAVMVKRFLPRAATLCHFFAS
ncbi:hypothetical protein CFC21_073076 [Triticum aestivum]|uniref:Uncharacterized protein n=3 Tax=Triticum TaxID=4564 RepID=A0A9R0XEZ3_TRITD|nr:hypothetical protein CFC21_073076 [Triticum aestivum]VAI35482.1 unnamed protein product [Triticum turgidum subsp. durum]